MKKEERLKTEVEAYFQKRKVEKKANAVLKEHVERLEQVYQNQYSTKKPNIALFEHATIKIMRKYRRTYSTVHAELLVALAIGKRYFKAFTGMMLNGFLLWSII